MKEIKLTQNQVALVDDCDFEKLSLFKWHAKKQCNTFYAATNLPCINQKQRTIRMHHIILGYSPKGLIIDHKNGVGTDNRQENLRFVTKRQNGQNLKKKNRKKTSRYSGVHWYKPTKKWVAMITIKGKTKNLGYSTDEKEAFGFYSEAVKNLGEKMLGE